MGGVGGVRGIRGGGVAAYRCWYSIRKLMEVSQQMLTGCLVNSASSSGVDTEAEKKKQQRGTGNRLKIKSCFFVF